MPFAVIGLLATASGASTTSTDSTALIVQSVIGILSVPFLAAALTALVRFMSPTQRISARLRSDLAIFRDLPSSAAKDVLKQRINDNLVLLNARYPSKPVAAVELGTQTEWRATGKPSNQPVGTYRIKNRFVRWALVVLTIVVTIVVFLAVIIFFRLPNQGYGSAAIPILIGAVLSLVWYGRNNIVKLFRRKPTVPPATEK